MKKQQDKYPYDSAIVGLNNVYYTIGDDSFYVNCDCIIVSDKILSIAREYFIFNFTTLPGNKMSDVLLVDCYYFEGVIHLIVEDVRSHQVFTISHSLKSKVNKCTMVLVDVDYFTDLLDKRALKDFCGCSPNKSNTNSEKELSINDDLLEFEF